MSDIKAQLRVRASHDKNSDEGQMFRIAADRIDELEKQLSRAQAQTKQLLEEVDVKSKTVQLLVIAGHVDKDRLEQATELAGGF